MTTHQLAAQLLGRPDIEVLTHVGSGSLDDRPIFRPYEFHPHTSKMRKKASALSEVWRESDGICETFKAQIL